tara:strand:- start:2000 stop:3229 length:1230 start_codon:yes stop_codon:yes gene_type:complete
MKFLTALGLGAKGMSESINLGLDRDLTRREKQKDRDAREASAAASRAHDLKLLYTRRKNDKLDSLVEVEEALRALNLDENVIAANLAGGMAGAERLKALHGIAMENDIDFNSAITATLGDNFNMDELEGGAVNFVRSNLLDARVDGKIYKNPYKVTVSDELKAFEAIGDPRGFKKQIESAQMKVFKLEQLTDQTTDPTKKNQYKNTIEKQNKFVDKLTKKYLELENEGSAGFDSTVNSLAVRLVNNAKKQRFGGLVEEDTLGNLKVKLEGNHGKAFESYLTTNESLKNLRFDYSPNNPNATVSIPMYNSLTSYGRSVIKEEYESAIADHLRNKAEGDRLVGSMRKIVPNIQNMSKQQIQQTIKAGTVVKNNAGQYKVFRGFAEPNQANPLGLAFFPTTLDPLELYTKSN